MEKEKALALQRELERAAREKERRELEEKRKRVGSLLDECVSSWLLQQQPPT